ncbi:hypothetical protein BJV82DRAFT_604176 [Fennellomyces sp. T-0311]|nr:hypothetical protein BJV82DRAFT_604176 [Fennellomyces sp. T-0311]
MTHMHGACTLSFHVHQSKRETYRRTVLLAKAPNVGHDGSTINRCKHEQRISQSQRLVVDVDPFAHSLKVGNGRPIRWFHTTLSFMSEQQTTGTTWPDQLYLYKRYTTDQFLDEPASQPTGRDFTLKSLEPPSTDLYTIFDQRWQVHEQLQPLSELGVKQLFPSEQSVTTMQKDAIACFWQ